MTAELLPDSRAKTTRGRIFRADGCWVPVFCANCGVEGGMCPEENMTFICWICAKCNVTYGAIAGTLSMPDEVFWREVAEAQRAKYGRVLTAEEVAKSLEDPLSLESRLAQSRADLTPRASA
jgi:hypothetical protein